MEIGYHAKSKSQLEDLFSSNTFGTADKHRTLVFQMLIKLAPLSQCFLNSRGTHLGEREEEKGV